MSHHYHLVPKKKSNVNNNSNNNCYRNSKRIDKFNNCLYTLASLSHHSWCLIHQDVCLSMIKEHHNTLQFKKKQLLQYEQMKKKSIENDNIEK